MSHNRRSLVRRLVATSAVWILVALVAVALALTTLFRQSVLRALDDRLTAVVANIVATSEPVEGGGVEPSRLPPDPRYERIFSGRYWQINRMDGEAVGEVVGNSRSVWDEPIPVRDKVEQSIIQEFGQPITYNAQGPDQQTLRVVAQAIELPGEGGRILVLAAEDRRPADAEVERFAMISIGIFLVFGIVLVAGVILQVRIGLSPVFRMRDSVANVREGRSRRVEGDFPVELQPLGDELNSLLDHSREVVERARTHVGNLAHALKTPIAVLMNETANDDSESARLVRRQTETMSRQVDHHLRRARAAAHAKALGAQCSVGDVVEDISRTLGKIYARQDKTISAEGHEGLSFRGERQDLEEMVGNLADNACKWAAKHATIRCGMTSEKTLFITVEDDGPGMPQEEREKALQRGVRLDEEAPGTGLGLSIVADLAHVYGGELELGDSEAGGLAAKLILPGRV